MNWQQKHRSLVVYQRNLIKYSEQDHVGFLNKIKLYGEILRMQETIDKINSMSVEKSLQVCDDHSISAVSSFYQIINEIKKVPKVRKTWGLSS